MVRGEQTEVVLTGAGWGDDIRVTARVIDANGVDRARPEVRIGERLSPGEGGTLLRHATLEPTDLRVGPYSLMLSVEDPTSGAVVSRAVPVAALEEPRRIALASISDRDQGPAGA